MGRGRTSVRHMLDNGLVSKISKELLPFNSKTDLALLKAHRRRKTAGRPTEGCSAPFDVRGGRGETAGRGLRGRAGRRAKGRRARGAAGLLEHCRRQGRVVQPLEKTARCFLQIETRFTAGPSLFTPSINTGKVTTCRTRQGSPDGGG